MEFNGSHSEQSFTISLDPVISDGAPAASPASGPLVRPFVERRRDRHGRGLRGPLLPASLPGSRTRSEKFEDLVVDSADRLRDLWPEALATVEYLVEEVPDQLETLIASGAQAPLGRYTPAVSGTSSAGGAATAAAQPPVISIYRHPVEVLCDTPAQVRELVHEVIVEQVAGLLNIDPDTVDPMFRRFRGH